MTVEEQEKQYKRAVRYFNNAKDTLSNSGIEGKFYTDEKYVSSASGVAYRGVLVALDCWLSLKGVEFPKEGKKHKSIEFYRYNVGKLNGKMLDLLNSVYSALHLSGYYECTTDSNIIKSGFESAKILIDLIKPTQEAV